MGIKCHIFVSLRQNGTHYISRFTDAYVKAIPVYCSFSITNCNISFGSCGDIVSYLCKFETKWHQILDANSKTLTKLLAGKMYIILFQSLVGRHVCDVINFMINVILSYHW